MISVITEYGNVKQKRLIAWQIKSAEYRRYTISPTISKTMFATFAIT